MTDPDTVERHEHVDLTTEVTIKSKRGTGTRDQDEVKIKARFEGVPVPPEVNDLRAHVKNVMNARREHQPDEEEHEGDE